MIQIKMALLDDFERDQEKIPARFKPYYTQDRTYVMHLREGETLLGVGSVTTLPGECAQINDLAVFQDDPGLIDGLLRALLNFLDICGTKTVACTKEALFPALGLLGFVQHPKKDAGQDLPPEQGAKKKISGLLLKNTAELSENSVWMELSLPGFFDQHC